MKRTPLWVFVAAVGLQIAALGLAVWAMESIGAGRLEDDVPAEDDRPERRTGADRRAGRERRALAPAPRIVHAQTYAPPPEAPAPEAPPARPVPPAPEVPLGPRFGPPPPRPTAAESPAPEPPAVAPAQAPVAAPAEAPAAPPTEAPAPPAAGRGVQFVTDAADENAQVLQGVFGDRMVAFGFYDEGNIRFVDVDGGRYEGKADSARARLREIDGTRAFTVQIGIDDEGRLQASFTGGLHDSETLPLEPLVGWSIA